VVRRVFVYALTTLAIALLIGVVVYLGGLYALSSGQGFSPGEVHVASGCCCPGDGGDSDGCGAG
jgi:hypothetical protein